MNVGCWETLFKSTLHLNHLFNFKHLCPGETWMFELKPLNTPQAGSARVHFLHFSSCSYLINKEKQLHLSLLSHADAVEQCLCSLHFFLCLHVVHAGASGGFETNTVFVCLALTTAMTHCIVLYCILLSILFSCVLLLFVYNFELLLNWLNFLWTKFVILILITTTQWICVAEISSTMYQRDGSISFTAWFSWYIYTLSVNCFLTTKDFFITPSGSKNLPLESQRVVCVLVRLLPVKAAQHRGSSNQSPVMVQSIHISGDNIWYWAACKSALLSFYCRLLSSFSCSPPPLALPL